MEDVPTSKLRPLREGMFHFDENGVPSALIGGRCTVCGQVSFPARKACGSCGPDAPIEEYLLSGKGRVYAATIVHVPSALGHKPPYAYGYVDLPADKTRIFAPLIGEDDTGWEPGQAVELVFCEIPAEKMQGVLGYAFTQALRGDDV
jgi:uncharacterized OB-fold protein